MNELQRPGDGWCSIGVVGAGREFGAGDGVRSRNTVIEVVAGTELATWLRAPGGGDKPLTEKQPGAVLDRGTPGVVWAPTGS